MDELLGEFLTEINENLGQLDQDLVLFEKDPENTELLGHIFRILHTIKGTCGFIGLPRLERVAHAGETLLEKFRKEEIKATPQAITCILECLDVIRHILSELETQGQEPEGDDTPLIKKLLHLSESTDLEGEPSKRKRTLTDKQNTTSQSIRVSIPLLEHLSATVGELVVTRNQLLLQASENPFLDSPLQRLNQVTSQLQEGVTKARMQPIRTAWSHLPRLVRDLAQDLQKEMNLEMVGAETELDRQLIELMKDPLTHMIRNAADHGLETPAERKELGKATAGTIELKAFQSGGYFVVEVSDDGRGIDPKILKEKILEKELATPSEIKGLTNEQLFLYIFHAGFSTSSDISNISGRGVGMDIVQSNIEKIGGTIEVQSELDQGTTFRITIPLTLSILSALIVGVEENSYALPQTNILEIIRISPRSDFQVEYINKNPILKRDKQLLQLICLKDFFNENGERKVRDKEGYIIVFTHEFHTFGLFVDCVFDTQEVVVSPLSPLLEKLQVYMGYSILGDGKVVMILDPKGILDRTGLTSSPLKDVDLEVDQDLTEQNRMNLMIFKSGGDKIPKAIPLTEIIRIETIPTKSIETSRDKWILQYKNDLIPLFTLESAPFDTEKLHQIVFIFSQEAQTIGLIVDEVVDSVVECVNIKMDASQDLTFGTAVLLGKTTEIIDIKTHIQKCFLSQRDDSALPKCNDRLRVLLVGNDVFFRNILGSLLKMEGYQVVFSPSLEHAQKMMSKGQPYDILVHNESKDFETWRQSDPHFPILCLVPDEMDIKPKNTQAPKITYLKKSNRKLILQTIETMIQKRRSQSA